MIKVGDRLHWKRLMRGGYGYSEYVPCVVVRLHDDRATIDAELKDGESKRVVVKKSNLTLAVRDAIRQD